MSSHHSPPPLKVSELAARLNILLSAAWRLLQRGELPRIKFGHSTRVPDEAVTAYITRQTKGGDK